MSLLEKMKLLWKGRGVLREAQTQAALINDAEKKSSWRSTEFWMTALTGLGAITAQLAGIIPPPWGAVVLAASGAFYAIGRGLVKRDDALGGVKPGYATTEFWMTALSAIGALLTSLAGAVKPELAATLVMAANAAYALSRSLAKSGEQPPTPPEAP